MKISYAITVCNEIQEIQKLLHHLQKHKRKEDEIIVLFDRTNGDDSIKQNLIRWEGIEIYFENFQQDFSSHKNKLFNYCEGDYLFFIDADELPHEFLIKNLPYVLENSDIDLLYVPRINTVSGITKDHILKWNWKINEEGWIQWPDYQSRIVRNKPELRWEGRVHETIKGYKTYSNLPKIEEWSLYHHKTIDKQEQQNKFYEKI